MDEGLGWDQKWLFVVTHFASRDRRTGLRSCKDNGAEGEKKDELQPVVFASSLSKYVFKKGRLTLPPERILKASGLLSVTDDEGQSSEEQKPFDQLIERDSVGWNMLVPEGDWKAFLRNCSEKLSEHMVLRLLICLMIFDIHTKLETPICTAGCIYNEIKQNQNAKTTRLYLVIGNSPPVLTCKIK